MDNDKYVISLGSSCDSATELKRAGVNNIHYFFDFSWNELDGLKTVKDIVENDFDKFFDIHNYTKIPEHPILGNNKKMWNVNKFYPNFVFMHHNTSKPKIIESLVRKIERTKDVFESKNKKIFIYYRHYHWDFNPCSDFNIIKDESKKFCEMYKNKYDDNFMLLSLVVYDKDYDKEIIDKEVLELQNDNTDNVKYDFVYRR